MGAEIFDNINDSLIMDTTVGTSRLDFNFDPPKVSYESNLLLDFFEVGIWINNENGRLILISNGMEIQDGDGVVIEDTINFSPWWNERIGVNNNQVVTKGMAWNQSSLCLDLPGQSEEYLIFSQIYDHVNDYSTRVQYARIDLDDGSGVPRVVARDIVILSDSLSQGGMNACKHANGRDWWLLFPTVYANKWHTFLVQPDTIEFVNTQTFNTPFERVLGQSVFSPDGSLFLVNSYENYGIGNGRVDLYEFDRCSGNLSHKFRDTVGAFTSNGSAFSNDNQFAYVSDDMNVYQYSLIVADIKSSRQTVAQYDGYEYFFPPTFVNSLPTYFENMGLAPDGRIYFNTTGSSRKMHVMHYPDRAGVDCDLRQHSLDLPTISTRTMPHHPYWRLGPLKGSGCDTLGIVNTMEARFRCDPDTTDALSLQFIDLSYYSPEDWYWDFGDNNTSTEQHPVHLYEDIGVYEVCLRASNDTEIDSTCKTLYLGVSGTSDLLEKDLDIDIYPNPTEGNFSVRLGTFVPQKGQLKILDLSGKEMFSEALRYGWNNYDITSLAIGTYLVVVQDGNQIVHTERIVKIR